MRQVAIHPNYPQFEGNRLFSLEHEYSGYWQKPFAALRAHAKEAGIQLDTLDCSDPATCDAVILMDLPREQKELRSLLQRAPNAKWILHLVESPLGRPYWFDRRNHQDFAAIMTYRSDLCDGQRYFYCPFPVGLAPQVAGGRSFSERKLLLILNNVGKVGIWANRGHGLIGLPFFGPLFSGFRFGIRDLLRQHAGEMMTRRLRLARTMEAVSPDLLDIYGGGWNGEQIGWMNHFVKNRPFAGFRGRKVQQFKVMGNYRFFLAFENIRADVGFITQKIFDAMHAGTVPVYLGDERIAEHVWPECFVDVRAFATDRELAVYLRDMPEKKWQRMRDAGREYLTSSAAAKFSAEAYAMRVLHAIRTTLAKA
jgi:hypothetical protein